MPHETAVKPKGPWSNAEVQRFLEGAEIPVRLACNGADGHPLLVSLWFIPEDGVLWCATQRDAAVASVLSRDPRCAFEVSVESPPYCGVRGKAIARLDDQRGEGVLRRLIQRYLGGFDSKLARFLLDRVAQETAICIEPETVVSWDFRERMGKSG
jgi:nitroimidazol reductase NimA-like FMN-containing flavoprotein (pyridoxamine 5'-phosphate oxidase superfamily)